MLLFPLAAMAGWKGGFDLTGSLVPEQDIQFLGPPKESIPPLDNPLFTVAEPAMLAPEDPVLGVVRGNQARAYPIKMLIRHQVVNDSIGGVPLVVSYDPLTDTGRVFLRQVSTDKTLSFAASALVYKSNLLLYDRETQSLWSQLGGRAISGLLKGTVFSALPASRASWAEWRQRYPDTQVMVPPAGASYHHNPYQAYQNSDPLWFDVAPKSPLYPNKAHVLGVIIDGQPKAYPESVLAEAGGEIQDDIGGLEIRVVWPPGSISGIIFDAQGAEITSILSYWFAWYAFYPDTLVYPASAPGEPIKKPPEGGFFNREEPG